jgi:gas vesicle protein
MADQKWEKQIMDFIKRTGEEIKRTGEEIKVEAQRLLDEVRDPARQAKVKETLKDLRDKATAISKDAADKLETAVKKVEGAVENALDLNKPEGTSKAPPAAAAPAPKPATPAKPARKAGKTIGKKAGAKKAAGTKSAAKAPAKKAPKSIGRKKPSA